MQLCREHFYLYQSGFKRSSDGLIKYPVEAERLNLQPGNIYRKVSAAVQRVLKEESYSDANLYSLY